MSLIHELRNYSKVVMVSGHFDPYPHIGHIRHMQEARELGNFLLVVLSTDKQAILKKGVCFTPAEERKEMLEALDCVDVVVEAMDEDGTVAETIRYYKPKYFAKGGDRTPDNMPQSEVLACKEVGCQMVFNVGLAVKSSRQIVRELFNTMLDKLFERGRPSGTGD